MINPISRAGFLRLAAMWVRLAHQLRQASMAHADLQHGNVLLVPGATAQRLKLRLIDYDVVAGLSDIYQMQDMYAASVGQLVTGMHAVTVFDPANRDFTIRQAAQSPWRSSDVQSLRCVRGLPA